MPPRVDDSLPTAALQVTRVPRSPWSHSIRAALWGAIPAAVIFALRDPAPPTVTPTLVTEPTPSPVALVDAFATPGDLRVLELALDAAADYEPLDDEARRAATAAMADEPLIFPLVEHARMPPVAPG